MSADGFGCPGGDQLVGRAIYNPAIRVWEQVELLRDAYPGSGERTDGADALNRIQRIHDRLDWLERRWDIFCTLAEKHPVLGEILDATEVAAQLLEKKL